MTDKPQVGLKKLCEAFIDGDISAGQFKRAVRIWHNKQVEEVLIGFAKEADTEYYRSEIDEWLFSLGLIVHKAIIEAERNKLKEEYNGKKEDEGSPGRAG